MQLLKKRILQDGKCYEGGILKVDSFINHQMDSANEVNWRRIRTSLCRDKRQ